MKIIHTIALSTALLATTSVMAQEHNPFSGESFEFSGNWNSNITDNYLVISSESIKNNTSNSKIVDVEFYFVPYQENYSTLQLSNHIPVSLTVGNIPANTTLKTQTKIQVDLNSINNLKLNSYKIVAVLKDRNTKEVLGNKIFNEIINFKISTSTDANTPITTQNTVTTPSNTTTTPLEVTSNNNKRDKDRIEFSNTIDQMAMVGEWKLDVDFKTLTVKIDGKGNDIVNKKSETTNDLKLFVYFIENLHDGSSKIIEGFEVVEADLKPIIQGGEFKNLKLDANITKYIPSGEYYPILLISELEPDGIYKIKTFIQFENKYTL